MKAIPNPQSDGSFYGRFGVGEADFAAIAGKSIFERGFADTDFPWHFSAGLASAIVEDFVENGKITADQADNLTLGDWANIIGSGWFSELAHSMAFTANGTWNSYGKYKPSYSKNALKQELDARFALKKSQGKTKLFDIHEEPHEGFIYLTASLDLDVRAKLRATMHSSVNQKSTGCPVARRTTRIPVEMAENDSHVKSLIDLGVMSVKRVTGDEALLEQEFTAIDRTLIFFAEQLDRYESFHGNPIITQSQALHKRNVIHEFRPPTHALRRVEGK